MHISWARLASFCHLGFISDPLIVSKFHNETHDPKGQENKTYTIVKGIKLFSYSTQLSMKFILLINVKMPTTVGILKFINMINTTSERLKARNFFIVSILVFMSRWVEHEKSFITSEPGPTFKWFKPFANIISGLQKLPLSRKELILGKTVKVQNFQNPELSKLRP